MDTSIGLLAPSKRHSSVLLRAHRNKVRRIINSVEQAFQFRKSIHRSHIADQTILIQFLRRPINPAFRAVLIEHLMPVSVRVKPALFKRCRQVTPRRTEESDIP
jgi:hypothetical protein